MLLETERLLVITGDFDPDLCDGIYTHEIYFRKGLTANQITRDVTNVVKSRRVIFSEDPSEKIVQLHQLIRKLYHLAFPIGEIMTSLSGEIMCIIFEERYRGKGYGTEALNECVSALVKDGAQRLFLDIEYGNLASKKMATKCGFYFTGEKHIKIGKGVETWEYKK